MRTTFAFASWALLALAGCGLSQRLATARHTRCKPGEVEVTEHQRMGKDERWVAICPEGRFECQALALEGGVHYRCRPVSRGRAADDSPAR